MRKYDDKIKELLEQNKELAKTYTIEEAKRTNNSEEERQQLTKLWSLRALMGINVEQIGIIKLLQEEKEE